MKSMGMDQHLGWCTDPFQARRILAYLASRLAEVATLVFNIPR